MDLFKKILIPLDGSAASEQALTFAGSLLDHAQEPVELLRIIPPLPLASPLRPLRTGQELVVEEEKAAAEQYLSDLRARFKQVRAGFTHHVEVGHPASGILNRIEEVKPTLVAITTHGRSGISRWVRGSVAEKVLRSAQAPLFLVQPGSQERIRRLLVPLDGSEASAKILPLAGQLAKAVDATVVLFHVGFRQGGQFTGSETGGVTLVTEKLIRDELEPHRRELEEAGVSARTRADFGLDPAVKIMEALEEEEIDAIAMTSHGRTGIDRWVFGSVAEKVLRGCSKALLLLPLRAQLTQNE